MTIFKRITARPVKLAGVAGIVATALSGCTNSPTGSEFNDPYEPLNRKTHAFNKGVDRIIYQPAGKVYGKVFSDLDDQIINNFADTVAAPGQAINSLLQGDVEHFVTSALRFGINATLGFAGIQDAATDFGIPQTDADFGQTLHKWGMEEGVYVELPIFGASTERDAIGRVVDIVLDPLGFYVSKDASLGLTAMKGIEQIGDRNTYSDLINGVLYESPDSYASQRIFYLQNRRFFLNGEVQVDDLEDPFADE